MLADLVIVGSLLGLAGAAYAFWRVVVQWQDKRRQQAVETARQMAAMRSVLRVQLAGRQAWWQLRQIEQQAHGRRSASR